MRATRHTEPGEAGPIRGVPVQTSPILVTALVACLVVACETAPRQIHVIATDYALLAPDSSPAGSTQFTLENRGRQVHELIVGLLRPGAGAQEMIDAGLKNAPLRSLGDYYLEGPPFGAVLTWPNATSPARLVVDLRSGRDYALLCQLRDSARAPQHTAVGMVHVLHVR